jgi:predicted nucleotidyltransferase
MDVGELLDRVTRWAAARSDLIGLALVGSHARGEARPDSDIDLVLLARRTSLRVHYEDGLEVEYGLTSSAWATPPIDEGTARVISGGMRILLDREGLLESALDVIGRRESPSHDDRPVGIADNG